LDLKWCRVIRIWNLVDYYIRQGGGGGQQDDLFRPVYVGSKYVQKKHGIRRFLAGLFRVVKPLALRGAEALDHQAFNTEAQMLADIRTKQPKTTFKDIEADRVF
jgi:hypothetical protein